MSNRDFKEHQNLNQSAIQFSAETIKSALLINGAAAVAVLSFAAKFVGHENADLHSIASSLLYYTFGVVAAVLGFALAYLTNYCLAGSIEGSAKWKKASLIFHILAMISVLASVGLFLFGSYAMKNAIMFKQENSAANSN